MPLSKSIDFLNENAGDVIKYRLHTEILQDVNKTEQDTSHVCRHTFCSRMASARMNPKTLQYIMGHSDISVTLNTYTHLGFDDALEEMTRISKAKDTKNHEDDTVVLKDFSEYKGKASNE